MKKIVWPLSWRLSLSVFLALASWGGTALAHDGHGLGGAHWHATDALGFVAAAAIAALVFFLGKK
jgi:hypothetical protein